MAQQSRRIPLPPEAGRPSSASSISFARNLGATPVRTIRFFRPDAAEPVPLSEEKYQQGVLDAMSQAGIDAALIYAFKRTGRIVTESNKQLLTEEELQEWNDAIDEYHRRVTSGEVI
jgi:hypothetical protein